MNKTWQDIIGGCMEGIHVKILPSPLATKHPMRLATNLHETVGCKSRQVVSKRLERQGARARGVAQDAHANRARRVRVLHAWHALNLVLSPRCLHTFASPRDAQQLGVGRV